MSEFVCISIFLNHAVSNLKYNVETQPMYLSPKPQGSTTILVKVIKLPRSLGTFAIFLAYCAMKYAGKGKVAAAAPQRAREQSLQKISWNGGDHLALQCHIKSNQLKHNGAFLPPCTVFYALWSWPIFDRSLVEAVQGIALSSWISSLICSICRVFRHVFVWDKSKHVWESYQIMSEYFKLFKTSLYMLRRIKSCQSISKYLRQV